METDQIFISEEEAGERLDKILALRFAGIRSRSYFQMLLEEGRVLLNGAEVKKRVKPEIGDEVQIHFMLAPEMGLVAEDIPLEILYEDEFLLAVNKPAGMVVHPATGNWTGTFVNALLYHCAHLCGNGASLRPGIVHRLDKDTSGVLLAAKTEMAQQKLIEMFAARQIYKEYLAVCVGNPGSGTIDAPIGRHPVHRQRMAVTEGGRQAVTHFKTVGTDGKLSTVEVILETGRTHQIRVHMQHRKTPVLGDPVYGCTQANAKYGAPRQLLHARLLRFKHPITDTEISIEAPIPDVMGRIPRT